MAQLEAIIEGLLYVVGDEGLSLDQLCEACEASPEEIKDSLDNMVAASLGEQRGLELVHYANVYKYVTKSILKEPVRKVLSISRTRQLSQSALETLAIIAYKQPITRVEIEEIRGVNCDMMCRKLVALDLIKEAGRSQALGRPILYEVTDAFLDGFKLTSLEELPSLPDYSEGENESIFK